jgi:threonine dehydratase
MFTLAELEAAQHAIHTVFPGTPYYAWPLLAQRIGADVWVKHENHTPTGAFKIPGRRIGLPLCGGNIDLAVFRRWISG